MTKTKSTSGVYLRAMFCFILLTNHIHGKEKTNRVILMILILHLGFRGYGITDLNYTRTKGAMKLIRKIATVMMITIYFLKAVILNAECKWENGQTYFDITIYRHLGNVSGKYHYPLYPICCCFCYQHRNTTNITISLYISTHTPNCHYSLLRILSSAQQ